MLTRAQVQYINKKHKTFFFIYLGSKSQMPCTESWQINNY